MLISCEKCKKVFEINERHLNAQGVTAVCPYCDHKHRVKRIVIPYSVSQEEDTEPYDSKELKKKNKNTAFVREDELERDIEPIEARAEIVVLAKDEPPPNSPSPAQEGMENQRSYHVVDRRSGVRGIILDRFAKVDVIYIVAASAVILGILAYLILG